jgi:hypothetical protein
MEYDRYQKFRQQTYQMLGKAKDATFELMDSVMTTKNASCLAEFSLSPLFRRNLVFSAAGFGENLVAGKVSRQMFTLGTAATSSSHRFIYNFGSGDLFYDSDGAGGNEQIKLARLGSGLSLASDNLFISTI